jgi:hypothetical protein
LIIEQHHTELAAEINDLVAERIQAGLTTPSEKR